MAQSETASKQNPRSRQGTGATTGKSLSAGRAFIENDFPLIRKAVICFAASLLFSALLFGSARYFLSTQQERMSQARAQHSEALNHRRQAEKDKKEIHDYQAQYIRLREQGFVGEEKRLDWIERVKQIRESRKLLPIAYQVAAQQVFLVDATVPMADLTLRGSKVQLQMDLLHELDLLHFLDDLSKKGFYTPLECAIKRLAVAPESAQSPRLSAECSLYWLTLGKQTNGQPEISQSDRP